MRTCAHCGIDVGVFYPMPGMQMEFSACKACLKVQMRVPCGCPDYFGKPAPDYKLLRDHRPTCPVVEALRVKGNPPWFVRPIVIQKDERQIIVFRDYTLLVWIATMLSAVATLVLHNLSRLGK